MTIESTGTAPAPGDRPAPRRGADRAAARDLRRAHAALRRVLRARAQGHAEGRSLLLPGERPVARVHRARHAARRSGTSTATSTSTSTTASASCASATRTRRSRRRSSGACDLGTHFAAPTEGSIAVAEELRRRFGLPQWRFTNSGHRVDDGRDPHRARRHGPRHDPQDRGLLPRAPRRRDGVRVPGARGARRPRRPRQRSLRRGLPARDSPS